MKKLLLAFLILYLAACMPVKKSVTNEYGLQAYSVLKKTNIARHTILISPPEAVAGYTSGDMRYSLRPYELSSFAHNAWHSPPADMLLPLIVKSLERSGLFYA